MLWTPARNHQSFTRVTNQRHDIQAKWVSPVLLTQGTWQTQWFSQTCLCLCTQLEGKGKHNWKFLFFPALTLITRHHHWYKWLPRWVLTRLMCIHYEFPDSGVQDLLQRILHCFQMGWQTPLPFTEVVRQGKNGNGHIFFSWKEKTIWEESQQIIKNLFFEFGRTHSQPSIENTRNSLHACVLIQN